MQVFPKLKIKFFNECDPGELVRFQYGNSQLTLAGTGTKGQRYMVRLEDADGALRPTYFLAEEEQLEQGVISYGTEYNIEVDHLENFEFGPQNFSMEAGLLILSDDQWWMVVRPPRRSYELNLGYFNFSNGMFGQGPKGHINARYTKWKITLPCPGPEQRMTLLSFEPAPQS